MVRILVADDNKPLLNAISTLLTSDGYEVTKTDNGADAICLLNTLPPQDLMILDLNMPAMGGYEVLANMGANAPSVIVLTGESVFWDKLDKAKVNRVLVKPVDASQLRAVVTEVLTTIRGVKNGP